MTETTEELSRAPRWTIVFQLMRATPTGQILTYEAMADALGLHPYNDRAVIQAAARRAAKRILHEDRRAFESVREEGYRCTRSDERIRLADGVQDRINTQVRKGKSLLDNVDLNGLPQDYQADVRGRRKTFSAYEELARRSTARQLEAEQDMQLILGSQEEERGTLDELLQRLKRIEQRMELPPGDSE